MDANKFSKEKSSMNKGKNRFKSIVSIMYREMSKTLLNLRMRIRFLKTSRKVYRLKLKGRVLKLFRVIMTSLPLNNLKKDAMSS